MNIAPVSVSAVKISDISGLDPINVYWEDFSPGKGQITITCYGSAWTAYWGAMGEDRKIRAFFLSCDTPYLTNRLGITQFLKTNKGHHQYLGRIIDAIKSALREISDVDHG